MQVKQKEKLVDLLTEILHEENKGTVTDIPVTSMAITLASWCEDAIEKYIAGAEEHSDSDIRTVDLHKELRNELIDAMWFNAATKW